MLKRSELEETIEKYRKNKTLVAPELLAGKFKEPFEKLKQRLKAEAEEYLRPFFHFDRLWILDDEEGRQVIVEINQHLQASGYAKRAGRAIFREFDLRQAEQITEAEGCRIYDGIYTDYFNRHTCLRASAGGQGGYAQAPRIYNDLVDKYYDEASGTWITDRAESAKPAILIFSGGGRHESTGK